MQKSTHEADCAPSMVTRKMLPGALFFVLRDALPRHKSDCTELVTKPLVLF